MEELKSTEVLDREILEDARKKAFKILKTADDTIESEARSWEKKKARAINSIRNTYAERIRKNEEEILARFPLDKRRLRSETAENFLQNAIKMFLRSLDRDRLLLILEDELSVRLGECTGDAAWGQGKSDADPLILYSGMSPAEGRAVLDKSFSRNNFLSAGWELRDDTRTHEFPSMVIDIRKLKISASVEDAADTIMKDKRAELASALLGEGVLND